MTAAAAITFLAAGCFAFALFIAYLIRRIE